MNSIISEDLKHINETTLPWEKLEGKTVLITGANGFLPAYIVETILYRNTHTLSAGKQIKVIALVRNKENAAKRFLDYATNSSFYIHTQDVSSEIKINEPVHYIIHAASQASPKYYGTDPVGTFLPNTIGTYHLLEFARKNPVEKFLFFSTSEVYGNAGETFLHIKEDNYGSINPATVRACYAESKRAGETLCISYLQQYNIPCVIVRPFHTYGPKLKLDDGRVFADFISNIVNNQNIVMNSDGLAVRAFCYLSDATKGFLTVLLKGENGEAYNVANPDGEISIIELAQLMVNLFPEKNLQVIKQNTQQGNQYLKSTVNKLTPDIDKLKQLGWQPAVSIADGFKRTVLSFQ